jgi:hypothetical protein
MMLTADVRIGVADNRALFHLASLTPFLPELESIVRGARG